MSSSARGGGLGEGRLQSPAAVALMVAMAALAAAIAAGWVIAQRPLVGLLAIAGLGALSLAAATYRRPDVGLVVLVLLLPFYPYVLARLQLWGLAPPVVAQLRYWKELVLVALVARAVRERLRTNTWLDRIAIGMMVLTAAFAVLPWGPADTLTRILAARQVAAPLVLFMAARHLGLPARVSHRIQTGLLLAGVGISLLAFWNQFAPDAWASFVGQSGLLAYERTALEIGSGPVIQRGVLAGHDFVRSGSIFLNPLSLGHWMLIPIGVAIARGVAGRPRGWEMIAGAICVAGLLTSFTRSAIVAVPLMVAVAVSCGLHRQRLAMGLFACTLALYPVFGALGVGDQLQSSFDPSNTSRQGHIEALQADVQGLIASPVGRGLGTAGTQGQRLDVVGRTTAESWYFQIGLEMGVLGMALFIALLVLVFRRLWARAKLGSTTATAALCAMAGLAFGGLVLHSFGDLQTSFAVWALCGLALPAVLPSTAAGRSPAPAAPAGLRLSAADAQGGVVLRGQPQVPAEAVAGVRQRDRHQPG